MRVAKPCPTPTQSVAIPLFKFILLNSCIKDLGLDESIVNVNGGAIAMGHPLGCSGARLVVTLIHELNRMHLKRGIATLCVGVGQGLATLITGETK
jgi:acetyl-CoA acetyltransferase